MCTCQYSIALVLVIPAARASRAWASALSAISVIAEVYPQQAQDNEDGHDQPRVTVHQSPAHNPHSVTHEAANAMDRNKTYLVADKNQPLSDEEISNLLTGKQYVIARRTVAKYREELNIPNKNFRKAEAA